MQSFCNGASDNRPLDSAESQGKPFLLSSSYSFLLSVVQNWNICIYHLSQKQICQLWRCCIFTFLRVLMHSVWSSKVDLLFLRQSNTDHWRILNWACIPGRFSLPHSGNISTVLTMWQCNLEVILIRSVVSSSQWLFYMLIFSETVTHIGKS